MINRIICRLCSRELPLLKSATPQAHAPQGITAMLSPGTFGHGGAYGTQAWIDPETKRIYILMVQRANFPNSDASEVRRAFQEAASTVFANLKSK
jgi:CubicO group peptidase (beta-lactamase class C family)